MSPRRSSPAPARPPSLRKEALRRYFFRPKWPVRWLAPGQLVTTGVQVALADQVGAYLDKRELQQLFPQGIIDESRPRGADGLPDPRLSRDELWLDFVADTGDGFHATYAVAYLLGKASLPVGRKRFLPRGQVLVMGGDQVYPTPSAEAYDNRLRGPFRAALPGVPDGQPGPTVYALPGNHDWYDGLTAFFRVFAGMKTTIGAWTTAQQRSYFALKLPHRWWLFAVDAQKGAHIDDPQLEYFHSVIHNELAEGDRVILCLPEPAWVQGARDADAYKATDYFLGKVVSVAGQAEWLGEKAKDRAWLQRQASEHPQATLTPKRVSVPLMLSGDWHHYARYEPKGPEDEPTQLITAGGGGAYLYGTHQLPRSITVPPPKMRLPRTDMSSDYTLARRYPSAPRSHWLGLGALLRLPVRNLSFVALLSVLQALLIFSVRRSAAEGASFSVVLMMTVFLVLALFLAAGLVAGRRRWVRIIVLTALHTWAQVQLGREVAEHWRELPAVDLSWWQPGPGLEQQAFEWTRQVLAVGHDFVAYALHGLVAGVGAAVIVALYLIVASYCGLNFNELFSSQRIEGFKGFLRLHVSADGSLTVHAIGVRRVRRIGPGFIAWHWRATPDATDPHAPWFEPRRRLRAHLIETVTIPGADAPPPGP